jgi:hypothetical protein
LGSGRESKRIPFIHCISIGPFLSNIFFHFDTNKFKSATFSLDFDHLIFIVVPNIGLQFSFFVTAGGITAATF